MGPFFFGTVYLAGKCFCRVPAAAHSSRVRNQEEARLSSCWIIESDTKEQGGRKSGWVSDIYTEETAPDGGNERNEEGGEMTKRAKRGFFRLLRAQARSQKKMLAFFFSSG